MPGTLGAYKKIYVLTLTSDEKCFINTLTCRRRKKVCKKMCGEKKIGLAGKEKRERMNVCMRT